MYTATEVLKILLIMSERTLNPYHRIMLKELQEQISTPVEFLMLRLCELENKGWIKINETDIISVNLTKRAIKDLRTAEGWI